MGFLNLIVIIPVALITGKGFARRWGGYFLLCASSLAIFWLQPALPVRGLDYWLPALAIFLVVFTWVAAQPLSDSDGTFHNRLLLLRTNLPGLLVLAGLILLLALTRFTGSSFFLTPSRPPPFWQVIAFLSLASLLIGLGIFIPGQRFHRGLGYGLISLVLLLLVILKSPWLLVKTSTLLRGLSGQSVALASPNDIIWLGFSYLAFRLIHVLRDHQGGKLTTYSLNEFVNYALFFPAYTAGPIDRSQRWIGEMRGKKAVLSPDIIEGSRRVFLGVFKKFVLADSLALLAVNSQNVTLVQSPVWAWILLYAYGLYIFMDFSGYTDIAIGLGRLAGFHLPENFDRPYLRTNLAGFWNSWHMTLAQWFRAYYFNPLTRALRTQHGKRHPPPLWFVILIGQVTTMLLIGLWHGITPTFAIWGLWHGVGLFIHNRWSDWLRSRSSWLENYPVLVKFSNFGGWLITFNFVTLGWVWFVAPSVPEAVNYFKLLTGN